MGRRINPKWTGLLIFFALASLVRVPSTHAIGDVLVLSDPDPVLESRCQIQNIVGTSSASHAQYNSRGFCDIVRIYPNSKTEQSYDSIKWEALGKHTANLGESEEKISLLRLVRPDQPNYQTIGIITAKMKCSQDPWLNPPQFGCTDLFYGRSETLSKYNLDNLYAKDKSVPRTSLLPSNQRAALQRQLQASQPARLKPNNPAIYANLATAPIIMNPQPNTRVTSSAFKIQIVPSKMLTGTHILVQFTKVDGPANQLKPTYAWSRPTSELANGASLPTNIVSNGQWTLRARIDAPKPGDFSADVPFAYAPAPIAITPRKNIDIYRR